MKDKNDCAVYALAFACYECPDRIRYLLSQQGREHGDGATDQQIMGVLRRLNAVVTPFKSPARTVRSFWRFCPEGTFLVYASDHVVAVVNGYVCDRPDVSDLLRIDKIQKIRFDLKHC